MLLLTDRIRFYWSAVFNIKGVMINVIKLETLARNDIDGGGPYDWVIDRDLCRSSNDAVCLWPDVIIKRNDSIIEGSVAG